MSANFHFGILYRELDMNLLDRTTIADGQDATTRVPSRIGSLLSTLGAGVIAGGLALLPVPAAAQLAPLFQLTADGFEVPMTVTTQADEAGKLFLFQGNYLDNAISTSLSGVSNADPFILWSFAATNATANPVAFVLTMVQPVIGGPYNRVVNGFSGSVTDLLGDGVSASTVANFVALFPGGFIGGSLLGGNCSYAGPNGPGFSGVCPVAPDTQFGPAITDVPADATWPWRPSCRSR
jgi:hypothetical protein